MTLLEQRCAASAEAIEQHRLSPFVERHLGPDPEQQQRMLQVLGFESLDAFVRAVVPADILDAEPPLQAMPEGVVEAQALAELREIASANRLHRSLIGLGYHDTATPALIQRHVLENPAWYTAYTPYQAEIAQGRLEALLNFQTLISELTGLPIANASLLDESTACAEAMSLSLAVCKRPQARRFLVDAAALPQTLAVLETRAVPLGISLEIGEPDAFRWDEDVFGVLLQLPGRNGHLWDPSALITAAHAHGALATVAIDPLAQVLLAPVGSLGADIAVGSAQRFGVPMAGGGPHAAFFATRESYKRQVPGRIVGQSVDAEGRPALRLALQTREQHIRRDKATSNICTAQVLLAVMASFYAIHHGPDGLAAIARRLVGQRIALERGLVALGYPLPQAPRFDGFDVVTPLAPAVHQRASERGFNLRVLPDGAPPEQAEGFGLSLDELTEPGELQALLTVLAEAVDQPVPALDSLATTPESVDLEQALPELPLRRGRWLQQPVFQRYRSETELLRYIQRLVSRDLSLVHSMIPLGSCTMKLNAAAELVPVSWRSFSGLHPFAPAEQCRGLQQLVDDLEGWLAALTGFAAVSLQPNAGSQGEYAGLLVIRAWHRSRQDAHRDVCLIPTSAHGTNPASAVMAGLRVVPVACDAQGNVDVEDLRAKAEQHSASLAALMVTYPSTHGVFETRIREICDLVHLHGGQVYLDGANLNAQVGLCRPGVYGADVCHLNLHKTFCIPHGGGGPGVGPIGVAAHLQPFLPGHPLVACGGNQAISPVSAAPWGSAGILPISWMYLRLMGPRGLRRASAVALLSANYLAHRLGDHYPVLFRGDAGLVAHECILDLRDLKRSAGLDVDDIAKRLMDYGFHAPTVSWPVAGTVMVEPTESESLPELDRFCDAMIAIRAEAAAIESGQMDSQNNPLKRAPHTLAAVTADHWDRPYTRTEAAYPMPNQREAKFWPHVARIDNAFGDRNLICTCPSVEELAAVQPAG
ncbi:glycine dehydrogenase [Synechococcus sp. WH 8101]|uniref:aminomethyl-transferring glycine dehydrogenase n=1 Tax=Synechococcus sp. WH 8101 TaxID=59932 RepID=UPI001023CD5D|nr:aminomethyl-transferring glycine dehydrogenase [Synechococcus sp. WH 8101]QNI46575.1 glycine dehydrogenase [Synechococcus sp. WH 8101]